MSRTSKHNDKYPKQRRAGGSRRDPRLQARAVRRAEPDLRRMGRALIELTLAEAEAKAAAPPITTPTPDSTVSADDQ